MTSLNGIRRRRLIAKETSVTNCEVLDEKHCNAVQGIFVRIIIKAGGASVKVTDLLFAFAFCKNKPGKLVSSLIGYLLISINKFSEPSF